MRQLDIDNLATELLTRYEQLTFLFDFGRHSSPLGEPAQLFEIATNKIAELYGASYVITLYHKDTIRHLAVAGVIQRHGGAITVASTPGQGTTFQVFLPRLEAPRTSPATTVRVHTASRESMLSVDDHDTKIQVGEGVQ
jgi:hypothetical protein